MKKPFLKNSVGGLINHLALIILIPVTLLYSCKSSNINNKLIPVKDLVPILTELYIADGILPFPSVQKRFASKDSTTNYIDIIKSYGYTKERMDKTMLYYFDKNPKKLENIYDQVLTRLNERQALLEKVRPPSLPGAENLWPLNYNISVPEIGMKDPVWFSIPVKDTGNYVLQFTAIVYTNDQSINPRVTVFFWHTDSSKAENRINWPVKVLPKDNQPHDYSLSKRNSDIAITHIGGWLLDSDPKTGVWEKHAVLNNIVLAKMAIE